VSFLRRCGTAALGAVSLLLTACQPQAKVAQADAAPAAETARPLLTPVAFTRPSPPPARKLPSDPHLLKALGDPARRLLPLFTALEEIERGSARKPIDLIQIGDSHTANGAFAGRMRELFQERFGGAGRGMLQPGIPFDYYKPQLVTVTEPLRWSLASSFHQNAREPWGISGTRETGQRPAEHMVLTSTEDGGFSHAFVEVLRQPGGGRLDVAIDAVPGIPIATGSSDTGSGWISIPAPPGSHELSLTPHGDGPVDILSWGTEREGAGILYENFGIIGATVDIMGRWDKDIVAAELAQRDPALVVIAFGTNEGFAPNVDPVAYHTLYAERVGMIKAAAPNAALVVIGPPDGNRLYRRERGQIGACVPRVAGDAQIAVSSTRQANARSGARTVWAPPPKLAEIRTAQREVAAQNGWYFWDWSAAMGGPCSMHRWTSFDPPLSAEDHVHLRQDGYRKTAELLFNELMAQYDRYRALRPVAATAR